MTKKDFLGGYLEAEKRLHLKRQKAAERAEAPMIEAETAQLLQRRAEVLTAIESAPESMMRIILEARYINGLKWEDISRLIGYSIDNTYKIHQKAIARLSFPIDVE